MNELPTGGWEFLFTLVFEIPNDPEGLLDRSQSDPKSLGVHSNKIVI
jgi:hypothetical protein